MKKLFPKGFTIKRCAVALPEASAGRGFLQSTNIHIHVKTAFAAIALLALLFILPQALGAPQDKLRGGLTETGLDSPQAQTFLIVPRNHADVVSVSQMLDRMGANYSFKRIGQVIIADMPGENVAVLLSNDEIREVWPDMEVLPVDEEALTQINARTAWSLGYMGEGRKIAILDTGIDASHPAFQDRVVLAKNFSSSNTVNDIHGHGTHVAGIAAGYGDVNGVAPQALLFNGKVLNDNGSGSYSSVINGINWAVENGADVINLSLGGLTHDYDTPLNQAVQDAMGAGVVVAVAAGNCGEECPSGSCNGFTGVTMPGNTKEALTVGAVDSQNGYACFSGGENIQGVGIKPDISAPGVEILSTLPGGGQGRKTGTVELVFNNTHTPMNRQVGSDSNAEFTGAIRHTTSTGTKNFQVVACDEFANCSQNTYSFQVVQLPQYCNGSLSLIVADNNSINATRGLQGVDLNSLPGCFAEWKTKEFGFPDFPFKDRFDTVFWSTGNYFGPAVSREDENKMNSVLAKGGRLLVEGSDVSSEHPFDGFALNVLHSEFALEIGQDENFGKGNGNGGGNGGGGMENWWSHDWNYARPVNYTGAHDSVDESTVFEFYMDTQALVSEGKLQADCDDLRIISNNGGVPTEVQREVKNCNTQNTRIRHRANYAVPADAEILASDSNGYFAYYGNSSTQNPGHDLREKLTTYFETDQANKLSVSDYSVSTSSPITKSEKEWLYRQISSTRDFNIEFTIKGTQWGNCNNFINVCMTDDENAGSYYLNPKVCVGLLVNGCNATGLVPFIATNNGRNCSGGCSGNGSGNIVNLGADYYGRFARKGSNAVFELFTDPQRTIPFNGMPLPLEVGEFDSNVFFAFNHEYLGLYTDPVGGGFSDIYFKLFYTQPSTTIGEEITKNTTSSWWNTEFTERRGVNLGGMHDAWDTSQTHTLTNIDTRAWNCGSSSNNVALVNEKTQTELDIRIEGECGVSTDANATFKFPQAVAQNAEYNFEAGTNGLAFYIKPGSPRANPKRNYSNAYYKYYGFESDSPGNLPAGWNGAVIATSQYAKNGTISAVNNAEMTTGYIMFDRVLRDPVKAEWWQRISVDEYFHQVQSDTEISKNEDFHIAVGTRDDLSNGPDDTCSRTNSITWACGAVPTNNDWDKVEVLVDGTTSKLHAVTANGTHYNWTNNDTPVDAPVETLGFWISSISSKMFVDEIFVSEILRNPPSFTLLEKEEYDNSGGDSNASRGKIVFFSTAPQEFTFETLDVNLDNAPFADAVTLADGNAFAIAGWDENHLAIVGHETCDAKTLFISFSLHALKTEDQEALLAQAKEWLLAPVSGKPCVQTATPRRLP